MFSTPNICLSQFNIEPGMVVADLGCGLGAYTFELADRVRSIGKVIAVDVQKSIVETLAAECQARALHHVTVLWDDMDDNQGLAFSDESLDRVVIANILYQLEDIQKFATEIRRIIKPKAQVLIIDWFDSFSGLGPPPQYVVKPERTQEIFERAGLHIHKKIAAGDHHYGFVLQSR